MKRISTVRPTLTDGPAAQRRVRAELLRPVVVVIPVYNAPEMLDGLVTSLEAALPEPLEGLTLLFSDDASPDTRLAAVYKRRFFNRPDVELRLNPSNLGFIGNVNGAISASRPDADILILNSDTEVWEEIFTTLQAEAHSDPSIASITPLTNNGTICSVFDFPEGADIPQDLSARQLARVSRALELPLMPAPAPTGVGFCMFLKREALDAIGLLDPSYGRGYGEECDWSRRAMRLGWKHFISSKAFVRHVGTQSFLSEEKKAFIAANGAKLLSRFPEYEREVSEYIRRDPLRLHRVALLAACLKERSEASAGTVYLMTLHADPDAPQAGGTEHHVRGLRQALVAEGHTVFELFPIARSEFELRAHTRSGRVLAERCAAGLLPELLRVVSPFIDTLHVHHTIHWPEAALDTLSRLAIPRKLFSAHDFYLVCPSINLSRLPGHHAFCIVEDDPATCDLCLRLHREHARMSIQVYRARNVAFLKQFDTILFPSKSLIPVFERGFRAAWGALADRVEVLHHDLDYVLEHVVQPSREPIRPPLHIAFVGALGPHKGADEILAAIPRLRQIGFTVEILGDISHRDAAALADVSIRPYRGPEELARLLRASRPSIVALPSTWPETFCYGFYEAAMLADAAVPVVGPFGHPAHVVTQEGFGVAMHDVSADALVDACLEASRSWGQRRPLLDAWIARLRSERLPYLEQYRKLELARGPDVDPRPRATPLHPDLLWALGRMAQLAVPQSELHEATTWRSPAPPPLWDQPLRYRLVDEANALIKRRIPFLHTLSKHLARRARDNT